MCRFREPARTKLTRAKPYRSRISSAAPLSSTPPALWRSMACSMAFAHRTLRRRLASHFCDSPARRASALDRRSRGEYSVLIALCHLHSAGGSLRLLLLGALKLLQLLRRPVRQKSLVQNAGEITAVPARLLTIAQTDGVDRLASGVGRAPKTDWAQPSVSAVLPSSEQSRTAFSMSQAHLTFSRKLSSCICVSSRRRASDRERG